MFFETYADCDDDFVRRSLPENLKPFWSVSNISSATNHYTPALNESFSMLLAKMSEHRDLLILWKWNMSQTMFRWSLVWLQPVWLRPALHAHLRPCDQGPGDPPQGRIQLCPLLPHGGCPHHPGHGGQVQHPGGSQLLRIKPGPLARNGNNATFRGPYELGFPTKIDWKVSNNVEH